MKRRHNRKITSKLGLLFIIIILSFTTISASYAHWSDELDINAEMTTIEYGSISGYVWLDDGDGVRESCEVIGIKDYTVTLVDTFLNKQIDTTTDDNGFYDFTGLLPVTYTVQITVVSPYTATTPTSYTITLTVGEHSTNNFGLQDTTMMGWWKFDEGTGTTATDSSTNGNHGTITGASWTNDGKVCKALDFDGSDDYVDCGSDTSLDITDTITVAAWVKLNNGGSDIWYDTVRRQTGYEISIQRGSSGIIEIALNDGSWHWYDSVSTINLDGTWYHIAFTWEKSTGKVRIYINGNLDVERNGITNSLQSTGKLWIGGAGTAWSTYGIIDEVKIYNRALTADEIFHIYNAEDT